MNAARPWNVAAAGLALRVTRRERAGAVLAHLGLGALGGGALGLVANALGAPPAAGLSVVVGGTALGAWRGLVAARAVPAVRAGDAAWALDRVAGLGEAGLAESEGGHPAPSAPPSVRLLPLRGLSQAVGGLLVAGLALALPVRAADHAPAADASPAEGATRVVGTVEAPRDLADAAARAAEATRVRLALGLPTSGELPEQVLREALEAPQAREAARAAADPQGALAKALAASPDAAAELARGLAEGARAAAGLEAARRQATALAWSDAAAHVPAERRALVARYMAAVRATETPR